MINYFRRLFTLMRENKLFSSIYIVGTAVAIASVTIVAMLFYVRIAPFYPETNRMRTFYMGTSHFMSEEENDMKTWFYSHKAVDECFRKLKNADVVTATLGNRNSCCIATAGDGEEFDACLKCTDCEFFRLYTYRFVEGHAFSKTEFEGGERVAVITDRVGHRVFGRESGFIGEPIKINNEVYRVCGVVEEASRLANNAFADVFLPYTSCSSYDSENPELPYYGDYTIKMLVSSAGQEEALRKELEEYVGRYNSYYPKLSGNDYEWVLGEAPRSFFQQGFDEGGGKRGNSIVWTVFGLFLLIAAALIVVPAINLSGMVAGRMEERLPEMGIRKAFGARRSQLLWQVLKDNFSLTLVGGVFGLVLAWVLMAVLRKMLLSNLFEMPTDTFIPGEVFFAPVVFVCAFCFCVVLNLLAAFIPAWLSLRRPIVKSMNETR